MGRNRRMVRIVLPEDGDVGVTRVQHGVLHHIALCVAPFVGKAGTLRSRAERALDFARCLERAGAAFGVDCFERAHLGHGSGIGHSAVEQGDGRHEVETDEMRAVGLRDLQRDLEPVGSPVRVREDYDHVFEAHGHPPEARH